MTIPWTSSQASGTASLLAAAKTEQPKPNDMRSTFSFARPVLLGTGLALSVMAWSQTVTVPANVRVMVPGVGGTVGLGGNVGHGGVICMPDPESAPPASTFNGGTVISWTLLGDISILASITPPTPPIQSAGATQQVKIMSYNKNLRQGFENSNPFIARSKGEVTVNYQSGACNRFITYQVLKNWTAPNPQIIGPDCWQPNQQYVYAVDIASGDNVLDQIGFDRYYWQVVDGNGNTFGTFSNNSAESSSIIFTTPSSLPTGPYTLKCCYGQCNNTAPWPGPTNNLGISLTEASTMTSCITKQVQGLPVASTLFPACIPIGTTSWPTINITPIPGYTYSYTAPCAWILTPSGTQGEDLTITGIDNNPCTITQTMSGPCGTIVFNYVVNRSFGTNQPTLTLSSSCVLAGANFTVSFPSNAVNNCATWVVRNSLNQVLTWNGTPGNGTNSVRTFTIPAGTPAGAYTVCATNCSCTGSSSCITVNVRPTTPVITGPTCVAFGTVQNQLYSCTTPSGVGTNSFVWSNTFNPAWVPDPASTTNSINLDASGNNSGQVRVIANGTNGCNSAQATLTVNRTPTTPAVNQPLCYNIGYPTTGVVFTVSNPQTSGNTYTWNFPTAFSPTGNTTGTSVTRNLTGTPGTYNCSVTNSNACGSAVYNFVITITAPPVFPVNNGPFSTISTTAVPGATYRLWDCNASAFVAGPQASNAFSLNNPGAGNYAIEVTLSALNGGCRWLTACVPTAHSNMRPEDPGPLTRPMNDIRVSPNPSDGLVRVDMNGEFLLASMEVFDTKGSSVLGSYRLSTGQNSVDLSGLATGTYHLRFEVDGKVETKEIIIQRH